MNNDFYQAIEGRRSIYSISREMTISDERLEKNLWRILKTMPSPMNSQSARILLLLNHHHDRFWDITLEALRKIVSEERFPATEKKIAGFAAGRGTILFFDDQEVIAGLQNKYPTYRDTFPVWGQQANAMLQYAVWTGLAEEGYGASLQHYTELVEDDVRKEWELPESWQLIAQMPFGKKTAPAGEKAIEPMEKRFLVRK